MPFNRKHYTKLSPNARRIYNETIYNKALNSGNMKEIETLTNDTILDRVWVTGSNDYQMRVPSATKGLMRDIVDTILTDDNIMNEFVDNLIQKIGLEIIQSPSWENPLSKFIKVAGTNGKTIQEIGFELIQGENYDQNNTNPYETNFSKKKEAFHKRNRQNTYKVSINEDMLIQSFNDEYGLATLLTGELNNLNVSASYDEYLLMMNTFNEFNNKKPLYNIEVPDLNSLSASESDIKQFAKVARVTASRFTILDSRYNSYALPMNCRKEDLILITTPEVVANLDVEVLAVAFNMNKADVPERIVEVKSIPIENAQALIIDKNALMYYTHIQKFKVIDNGMSLVKNYVYHIHQTLSLSYMKNMVLLSKNPGTALDTHVFEYDSTIFNRDLVNKKTNEIIETGLSSVSKSELKENNIKLSTILKGTFTPPNANLDKNLEGATYLLEISHEEDDGTGTMVQVSDNIQGTYIDSIGYLHIADVMLIDSIEYTLKITSFPTYSDKIDYATYSTIVLTNE